MRIVFIEKKKFLFVFAICICFFVGGWFLIRPNAVETVGHSTEAKRYSIHMVTGEFESSNDEGKKFEAYRWDPGTIYVPEDQPVRLSIFGVNGNEHPFYIEGTDIKGTVKKGVETVISVRFKKEGIYRLICTAHHDISHNGPMVAYIVVD